MTEHIRRLDDDATQVFVAIENRLVRETLVRLFQKRPDLRVVGQGASAEVNDVLNSHCDIVLLDDLRAASILAARLLDRFPVPGTVGLVLVGMEDDEAQFLKAVRSGVSGYLLSDAQASDVISAVRAVARGEAACPPGLCLALFRHVALCAKRETLAQVQQGSVHGLTIRQQQLVALVARGLTNKEIASQLNLSEFTIKNHIHRIMKQVEVESRYEMVKAVVASGDLGHA